MAVGGDSETWLRTGQVRLPWPVWRGAGAAVLEPDGGDGVGRVMARGRLVFCGFRGLHGLWMVLFRVFERMRDRMFPQLAGSRWLGAILRAFILAAVTATWIPFRAGSLDQIWAMLSSMLFGFQPGLSYSVNFYLVTLLFASFCVIEPYLADLMGRLDSRCADQTAALAANQDVFRPFP